MDASPNSTIARVLDIPEILELVFSFLDKDLNKNNITVCKKWSELAMNIVWRDVNCPRRLFSLLAPMKRRVERYDVYDHWVFSKTFGVPDWTRFMQYSRRVRSMHYDERALATNSIISQEAFDEMSRSRTNLNILPNLRSLVWLATSVVRMRHSLLFQHESITSFTVYLHHTELYPLSAFVQEVLLRMPNLLNLDLRFERPAREIERELIELFAGLPMLQRVVLPVYTLTSKIIEQLSKHQHLGTIQFEYVNDQGHGEMQDVVDWDPQLGEGSFPALWDLSLSTKIPAITKFIHNGYMPSSLKSLYIHVLAAVPVESVSHFLEMLSNSCKHLTHLYLDFFTSSTISPTPPEWPRLNWASLRPILAFPQLISLELRWDRPLDISLSDIEEMASQWPHLETLLLNCEPMDMTIPPALDLRALLPFARHCPKLVELGLYMTASNDIPVPQLDYHTPTPTKPFSSLEQITVGGSRITDVGHVAMFLSQICPVGCTVAYGVAWPDGYGVVETAGNAEELGRMQEDATGNFQRWEEVNRMLPLLVRLRMDERKAREDVQREVEDLRIRCGLLAERRAAGGKLGFADGEGCVPF
ncbi:hypothetical protein BDY19DRAFT_996186 [Irpex rosettiformis]|uniref:Uncharacterized protein n=1 Tax=Irpex rosettiformis TaxID=378272 RepID=A0ACB8TVD0_9APHY|nr:hypothetical protein BDY19DRAFT_996186 [Irpex rosettiformis]